MKFKLTGHQVPLIYSGYESYAVVTDDEHETEIARHVFLSPNVKSPRYEEYMEDQKRIANTLLAMLQDNSTAPRQAKHIREINAKYKSK